jgi:hypothetical protein
MVVLKIQHTTRSPRKPPTHHRGIYTHRLPNRSTAGMNINDSDTYSNISINWTTCRVAGVRSENPGSKYILEYLKELEVKIPKNS